MRHYASVVFTVLLLMFAGNQTFCQKARKADGGIIYSKQTTTTVKQDILIIKNNPPAQKFNFSVPKKNEPEKKLDTVYITPVVPTNSATNTNIQAQEFANGFNEAFKGNEARNNELNKEVTDIQSKKESSEIELKNKQKSVFGKLLYKEKQKDPENNVLMTSSIIEDSKMNDDANSFSNLVEDATIEAIIENTKYSEVIKSGYDYYNKFKSFSKSITATLNGEITQETVEIWNTGTTTNSIIAAIKNHSGTNAVNSGNVVINNFDNSVSNYFSNDDIGNAGNLSSPANISPLTINQQKPWTVKDAAVVITIGVIAYPAAIMVGIGAAAYYGFTR